MKLEVDIDSRFLNEVRVSARLVGMTVEDFARFWVEKGVQECLECLEWTPEQDQKGIDTTNIRSIHQGASVAVSKQNRRQ